MTRATGRMIRQDVSRSRKIAELSPKALSLFLMLIPHYNAHGKMNGDPMYIKSEVVPLVPWLSLPAIRKILAEIHQQTSVKWFHHEGRWYLHSLSWKDHQEIREDRLGKDSLPSFSSEVPDNSGNTPGVLLHEVNRRKEKKKLREVPSAGGVGAPRTATPKNPVWGNGGNAGQVIPDELREWGDRLADKAKKKQAKLGIDPEADND